MTEIPSLPAEPKPTKRSKSDDTISQLQKLVESMSSEDRDKLERAGVVLPTGSLTAVRDERFKYGLRCTHCNRIALYFVGDSWEVDGQVTDMPPPLPHHRLMWTQELPPGEIDRHTPRCQHCAVPVTLNKDGSFARERSRVILVAEWQSSRDKSYAEGRKEAKRREAGSATVENVEGLSTDYSTPKEPVSAVIARQRGEQTLGEIEFVAQQTGADKFGANRR